MILIPKRDETIFDIIYIFTAADSDLENSEQEVKTEQLKDGMQKCEENKFHFVMTSNENEKFQIPLAQYIKLTYISRENERVFFNWFSEGLMYTIFRSEEELDENLKRNELKKKSVKSIIK